MNPAQPDILPDYIPGQEAMLFSSFEYLLVFLPITVVIYFQLTRLRGNQASKYWLVAASLFFYGWWSLSYLWLIGVSILFNYCMARWIGATGRSHAGYLLAGAITGNIALLGYYKYADFFIENLNQLTHSNLVLLQLALPLGISFFTFTQIAFLIDVRRGKASEYSLLHYCLFVTYFPHLIAGPILHHREMMPQFMSSATRKANWQNIHTGILLIALGLIKKAGLADSLAVIADEGFNSSTPLLFHQAWMASLGYSLQLYFDFSGYTDMAIGSALLCNIRLPVNFNSPYQATNIRDFWRRWHITLSRWLRDYLYIPLGGNRHGAARSYTALLITFGLGGLWHGANWTFVLWGLLHGSAAALHKGWQNAGLQLPAWGGWILTLLFVNATWVFFRAGTPAQALDILASMTGRHGFAPTVELVEIVRNILEPDTWNPLLLPSSGRQVVVLLASLLIVLFARNSLSLAEGSLLSASSKHTAILSGILVGAALFITLFLTNGITPFIYFYF